MKPIDHEKDRIAIVEFLSSQETACVPVDVVERRFPAIRRLLPRMQYDGLVSKRYKFSATEKTIEYVALTRRGSK